MTDFMIVASFGRYVAISGQDHERPLADLQAVRSQWRMGLDQPQCGSG
jgi:hypothetical protein